MKAKKLIFSGIIALSLLLSMQFVKTNCEAHAGAWIAEKIEANAVATAGIGFVAGEAGAAFGRWAGAKYGALIGTAIAPGAGTVVGGLVGGLVGVM